MRRILSVVVCLGSFVANLAFFPAPVAAAASCQFVLGFQALHDTIPGVVGDCLVDEHHNALNGDGLQETTDGLLVWRKADNWTAFTDGYRTWVNGPFGLQLRLNTQRFGWEANPDGLPLVGAPPIPPANSGAAPVSASGGVSRCSANLGPAKMRPMCIAE